MSHTTTAPTTTRCISQEFDMEADPRIAQGIRDLGYSGYTRQDLRIFLQTTSAQLSSVSSDHAKPKGAFGS